MNLSFKKKRSVSMQSSFSYSNLPPEELRTLTVGLEAIQVVGDSLVCWSGDTDLDFCRETV